MSRYSRRNRYDTSDFIRDICFVIFLPVIIIIFFIKLLFKAIKKIVEHNRIKKMQKYDELQIAQKNATTQQNTAITPKTETKQYVVKNLLTHTEEEYFEVIKRATPTGYTVYPQVNLATIIKAVDNYKYHSELFRNIDFAIFDRYNSPVLLIEINDKTHKKLDRIERDKKVKEICAKARIPLITFWTDCGINPPYIQHQIARYCQ